MLSDNYRLLKKFKQNKRNRTTILHKYLSFQYGVCLAWKLRIHRKNDVQDQLIRNSIIIYNNYRFHLVT